MMYLAKDGTFKFTESDNDKIFFDFIQELALLKGENPIRINRGIDYMAVFNMEAFLQVEVQEVIQSHLANFAGIDVGEIKQSGDVYSVPLTITFKNGEVRNETLELIR